MYFLDRIIHHMLRPFVQLWCSLTKPKPAAPSNVIYLQLCRPPIGQDDPVVETSLDQAIWNVVSTWRLASSSGAPRRITSQEFDALLDAISSVTPPYYLLPVDEADLRQRVQKWWGDFTIFNELTRKYDPVFDHIHPEHMVGFALDIASRDFWYAPLD